MKNFFKIVIGQDDRTGKVSNTGRARHIQQN